MNDSEDRDYYVGRCREEMDRGGIAADPNSAAAHYELAYRYSLKAADPELEVSALAHVRNEMDRIRA